MTLGEKLKVLRNQEGMTQEALAEKLNVSRSAIAKWENGNGIPEISNLQLICKVFDVRLDDILADENENHTAEDKNEPSTMKKAQIGYIGWYCSIELVGWNDGAYDVLFLGEDEDFVFYQKTEKQRNIYGMLGKKYIRSIEKEKQCDTVKDVPNIDRNYFCNKNVFVEIAHKNGLLKGFFDFKNDDYLDVFISHFDDSKVWLSFGRELDICNVTKIEEL